MKEKEVEGESSGSWEKFYDAVEEEGTIDEVVESLAVVDKVVEDPTVAIPEALAVQTKLRWIELSKGIPNSRSYTNS
ncbi:hypothetical protein Dimus_028954 [Dionaea muscipula]